MESNLIFPIDQGYESIHCKGFHYRVLVSERASYLKDGGVFIAFSLAEMAVDGSAQASGSKYGVPD